MGEVEDNIIENDNMYEDFKHSKPLKPAGENKAANEDTDSEDECNEKGQGPTEQQLEPYIYTNEW